MKKLKLLLWSLPALGLLGAAPYRDPTQPPAFVQGIVQDDKSAPSSLILNATYVYPTKQYALINGSLFKKGDQLGQFTIIAITPYSVELEGPQNTKEVLLLFTQVKKSKAP